MNQKPTIRFTDHLPDLITPDDYETAHYHKTVRLRLRVTDEGVEILGDSPYAGLLEDLLAELDPEAIEMMLCG